MRDHVGIGCLGPDRELGAVVLPAGGCGRQCGQDRLGPIRIPAVARVGRGLDNRYPRRRGCFTRGLHRPHAGGAAEESGEREPRCEGNRAQPRGRPAAAKHRARARERARREGHDERHAPLADHLRQLHERGDRRHAAGRAPREDGRNQGSQDDSRGKRPGGRDAAPDQEPVGNGGGSPAPALLDREEDERQPSHARRQGREAGDDARDEPQRDEVRPRPERDTERARAPERPGAAGVGALAGRLPGLLEQVGQPRHPEPQRGVEVGRRGGAREQAASEERRADVPGRHESSGKTTRSRTSCRRGRGRRRTCSTSVRSPGR